MTPVSLPPLKGEGDREAVEGFTKSDYLELIWSVEFDGK